MITLRAWNPVAMQKCGAVDVADEIPCVVYRRLNAVEANPARS